MRLKKISGIVSIIAVAIVLTACGAKPSGTVVQQSSIPPGKFYFYSADCAHCITVSKYVSDNKLKTKLYYIEKEVGNDIAATNLLRTIGKRCGLTTADLAVPLFWDGSACHIGDSEVISYFESL